MKILVFDNYDSFTYNLVHIVEKILNKKVDVYRNDKIALEEVKQYDKIILSPGPGIPSESGLLLPLIKEYAPLKPILGVCLGLQHLTELFGGKLYNQQKVLHGKQIILQLTAPHFLFNNIKAPVKAGLYHSWAADNNSFPQCLQVTSVSESGVIMSFQHKTLPLTAVQFHPESYMTEHGNAMIKNWVEFINK